MQVGGERFPCEDRVTWQVLGVSVQGLGHEQNGLPCQDSFAYHLIPDAGICIVAVADGAGSALYSDQGARVATKAATEALAQNYEKLLTPLNEQSWQAIALETAQKALEAVEAHKASRPGTDLGDYASTLLLIVVMSNWVAGFQIGDGAILIEKNQQELSFLLQPPGGEYINETFFLTSQDALNKMSVAYKEECISRAILMTDGLSLLAFKLPGPTIHHPFFKPFLELAADQTVSQEDKESKMRSFFTSDRVRQRTDDDITMVIVNALPSEVKSEQAVPCPEAPYSVPSSTQPESTSPPSPDTEPAQEIPPLEAPHSVPSSTPPTSEASPRTSPPSHRASPSQPSISLVDIIVRLWGFICSLFRRPGT